MNRTIVQRLFWIALLVICCLCIFIPVFRPGLLVTDDGTWMVIRLSAFYQSFREGQFPVRFLGRLNYSYGYPVANFLYPGFLYAGSLLHVIGLPFQQAVEAIIIGSVISGAVGIFLWLRRFFDDRASVIGAASFLFMPYILYDVFKRGSVGEIFAIGLCLVSLYAIETKRRWLFPPLLALLAISHNTLALFFIPALLGYVVIKKYWDLMAAFLIGVGMSAFFWLPVFIDRHTVLFDGVAVSDPAAYFQASHFLIIQGLPFVIVAILSLMFWKKQNGTRGLQWYLFGILVVSTFFASQISTFFWQNQTFAKYIQFPYRFLSLWCFAGPWFVASVASGKKYTRGTLLALAAVTILIFFSLPYQKSESVVRPEGFFTTNEGTTTVANEYMPKWVSTMPTKRADKRIELFKGKAEISESLVSTEKIEVVIQAHEDSIFQINTIYYPGWGALLDNKPVDISYDNAGGVMRVAVPVGTHRLYMAFRETGERFLADLVSGIFVILYIMFYCVSPIVKRMLSVFARSKR